MTGINLPIRRLGVENWTPEDFAEDSRRRHASQAVYGLRKQALLDRGWELHFAYCSCDHGGEHALDPITGNKMSHEEAYQLQEKREPGSIPPWPKFDNNWKPPPSTEGLIHIERVNIQPMDISAASIFYVDATYEGI